MSFISKILGKKEEEQKVGGMEDFMTLIRVYFQAVMAADLGITNLNALPDLRVFKTTLRVPTQGGKLGIGEKARCKKIQDVQTYLLQFQTYVQDVMMLSGNLMKFKLRLPGFFKKAIYAATEKTVHDIFNKNDYKDAGVLKTVVSIRELDKRLGFSEKWTTDFVYRVVMLAKKEKQPQTDEK